VKVRTPSSSSTTHLVWATSSRLEGKGRKAARALELAEIVKLTPMRWPRARAESLEIEKRAYLYGRRRRRTDEGCDKC